MASWMNPMKIPRPTFILWGLISLALASCADLGPLHGPSSADRQAVRQGAHLAASECSACHVIGTGGVNARTGAPAFATIAERYRDTRLDWELEAVSQVGHYRMPRKPLTVEEIAALTAYIRSLDRGASK